MIVLQALVRDCLIVTILRDVPAVNCGSRVFLKKRDMKIFQNHVTI